MVIDRMSEQINSEREQFNNSNRRTSDGRMERQSSPSLFAAVREITTPATNNKLQDIIQRLIGSSVHAIQHHHNSRFRQIDRSLQTPYDNSYVCREPVLLRARNERLSERERKRRGGFVWTRTKRTGIEREE